jgi:hypothetical protein
MSQPFSRLKIMTNIIIDPNFHDTTLNVMPDSLTPNAIKPFYSQHLLQKESFNFIVGLLKINFEKDTI